MLALAVLGLIVVLKPGGAGNVPKASNPREANAKADHEAAKDIEKPDAASPKPVPKAQPDEDFQGELAALKATCLASAGKDQFGKAIEQIDAFTKKLPDSFPKVSNLRELASQLRDQVLTRADARYTDLLTAVQEALSAKDYPKARAALRPAESFGIDALAEQARKKLAEIDSREKSAADWAKWDEIKTQAKKLADAGQLDEAAKLLETAKGIALDNLADLMAEQMESIESIKSTRLKAALAAYAKESDQVWALFKDRKYSEADKLLADLAARGVGAGLVPAPIGAPTRGAPTADQEAAKLLKEFWAAVERGLAAKKGQAIVLAGAAGTLLDVKDGVATIQAPGAETKRPITLMGAKQAVAYADLKKDDPHSALLKGVFLLTQAEGPDAEKALAAAGDAPNLARYKDRLAALTLGTQELAARKAWQEIEALGQAKPSAANAKRLSALLDDFSQKHANTKTGEAAQEKMAALRERAQEGAQPAAKAGAYALQFNGVDDDVAVPFTEAHRLKGVFTVEARFCAESPVKSGGIVVKRPTAYKPGGGFIVRVEGNTLVFFVASSEPDNWNRLQGPPIELGRWYHVAFQYDEKRMVAYLDGEKAAELLVKRPFLTDEWPVHIGREVNDGCTFAGRIREVRLWHAFRTEAEIRQTMNRPLKGTEPNLVGYWDFSEGSGDLLHDRTQQKSHAKIHGAKWVTPEGKSTRKGPEAVADEPKASKWVTLLDAKNPGASYTAKQLLPANGVEARAVGPLLRLIGPPGAHFAQACSRDDLSAPLHIRAVAMTDSHDLRLYYAGYRLIFNWESNQSELRLAPPGDGGGFGFPGKGKVPPKEYVQVDWKFDKERMTVLVNGEERASVPGRYSNLRGAVGIGPYASTVTVKELAVTGPKAEKEPKAHKMASLLEIKNPAKAHEEGLLTEQGEIAVRTAPLGVRLTDPKTTDSARLVTKEEFGTPLRIRVVAMTDSTNLRLYFAGCRLLFNWELNQDEMHFHYPPHDFDVPVPAAGRIPTREWVEVVWTFEECRATISVNGKERVLVPGPFATLRGPVGIGPAQGSVVTLKELSISAPKAEPPAKAGE